MRKNKKAVVKPLAVVTEEERLDYARRMALFQTKQLEALAAASYLDALGEEFKVKYDLPTAYTFDPSTGHCTEVPNAQADSV